MSIQFKVSKMFNKICCFMYENEVWNIYTTVYTTIECNSEDEIIKVYKLILFVFVSNENLYEH